MFNIQHYKIIQNNISDKKICTVIKNRSSEEINECLNFCNLIGVNRWQEFKEKFVETQNFASLQKNQKIQFHFIGHLQKNKVKEVIKYFDCIQSVDSLELIKKINVETQNFTSIQKKQKKINIMLQINISNDPNKHGFKTDELKNILVETHCNASLRNIKIIGFMTITAKEDKEKIREDYRAMKKLFDQYQKQYNLTELSMGMSGDYKIAIEEGATMIRLGTTLFK